MSKGKKCKCDEEIDNKYYNWIMARYLLIGLGIAMLTYAVFQQPSPITFEDTIAIVFALICGCAALLYAGYVESKHTKRIFKEYCS
jgi:xanthine/uracil permease